MLEHRFAVLVAGHGSGSGMDPSLLPGRIDIARRLLAQLPGDALLVSGGDPIQEKIDIGTARDMLRRVLPKSKMLAFQVGAVLGTSYEVAFHDFASYVPSLDARVRSPKISAK